MDTNVYKIEFYLEGTEDTAYELRRYLAQHVSDEFDIRRVFGVTVCQDSVAKCSTGLAQSITL